MNEPRTMVANVADPEQVRAAGRRERFNRRIELEELKKLLELPSFRRLMWRYMGKCKIWEGVYTGEAMGTAYNEGQRMVGNSIFNDILEADPDAYLKMLKEARAAEEPKKEKDDGGRAGEDE